MAAPIATWNPARDVWETGITDLFSEHSDAFLETWPSWGMTRDGVAFELPTSAHLMDDSASSSLLPTPEAYEGSRGGSQHPDKRRAGGHSTTLQDIAEWTLMLPSAVMSLLPTPRAAADRASRPSMMRKGHWSAPSLAQAVEIAQGTLPREFHGWDEVPGWHGDHMNPRFAAGNEP